MSSAVQGRGKPIIPVILCGGSGTRLWPLSRSLYPKQLVSLQEEQTLLQSTVRRVAGQGYAKPLIVANEEHRFLIVDQLEGLGAGPEAVILEPQGRNTAPAIALAAQVAAADDPDALLLVMPSDHLVGDGAAFHRAIDTGRAAAEAGALVTFGAAARSPETGYGYIEASSDGVSDEGARPVARFVEKPDLATAAAYVASGHHYWNCGIFLFTASAYLDELRRLVPDVARSTATAIEQAAADGLFLRPEAQAFARSPSISIDYAVMEKTDRARVVPVDMGWSDVGSWNSLWEISPKDSKGNALAGDVLPIDTRDSLIRSDGSLTVATVGVKDLVVVATRDAVLILPRDRAQDTRLVVDALKEQGRDSVMQHTQVHRPWGTYETMDRGDRFQTKRIVVKPGAKLSLQKHHHRSEHWVVVSGTAEVTVGEKTFLLQENQSTYIPAGEVHRLANPGRVPLHLIEVQCGPYLGEDDIVRIEDTYGRN
ncbi:mannose-1-phosphate guanylyltransferase/mannose-6-phosphate isomerase [Sphingomonas arenae]|uniref:mannose-1-phosphate guanylyltransferase/mannose-6-phosphate isomerase n=1 Tax=Sphingomonas arenae TaxID=2812555 RepID=UPI0030139101